MRELYESCGIWRHNMVIKKSNKKYSQSEIYFSKTLKSAEKTRF